MKCHYEVLNIARDADESEIKTAYKKLALKWHPDKNLDNPDEAKEQFQLVQQAYEILSDKHERAWYDNHREQILRGSDTEYQDNSVNVFQYFSTTCFKGYSDDENGFYTVYRKVFEEIAKEDMEHMEDKEEFTQIPSFGNSNSDYEETVGPFYAYWMSYSTKKSYVWLDPYDIKDTRDRRVLKLIEKENKKVRLKAKKERNEEVRSLVAFVRKRDKRVQAYSKKLEEKVMENRKKQELIRKQRRLERAQELNVSKEEPDWAKFDNVKSELEEMEKSLAAEFGEDLSMSEEEEDDIENLYCVACNKMFKTPKAFQNHESSRKHKENVEIIKQTMMEEDEHISTSNEDLELVPDSEVNLSEELVVSESDSEHKSRKQKKKNKKSKNVLRVQHVSESNSEEITLNDIVEPVDDSDDGLSSSKKQKKKSKKNKIKVKSTNLNDAKSESLSNDVVENKDACEKSNSEMKGELKSEHSNSKKQKKHSKRSTEEHILDTSHHCVTCKANFPSKNKLFDHLKSSGHSVFIGSSEPNVKTKKKLKERM